jgi:hypothetical protein
MAQVEDILDAIRTCARTADFAGLAALAHALEVAMSDKTNLPDLKALGRIKAKAEETQGHLDAARRELRSARRRFGDLRRVKQGLQTYDGKGRRADITPAGQTAGRF